MPRGGRSEQHATFHGAGNQGETPTRASQETPNQGQRWRPAEAVIRRTTLTPMIGEGVAGQWDGDQGDIVCQGPKASRGWPRRVAARERFAEGVMEQVGAKPAIPRRR